MTYHVLGHRGMLGSVVTRRWAELGATWAPIATADHIINCVFPDSWTLLSMLPKDRVIQPSTDAIAEDTPYAETKRQVESMVANGGGLVLRTGLVDVRKHHPVAYANWFVNPLTPLEWAELAWERKDRPALYVDGREPMNKWRLGVSVADAFGLERPHATMAATSCIRIQPASRDWPSLPEALLAWGAWA